MRYIRTVLGAAAIASAAAFAGTAHAATAEEIVKDFEAMRAGPTTDIELSVSGGIAVVTGEVPTALDRRALTERLREASDVDEIIDLVVLDRP